MSDASTALKSLFYVRQSYDFSGAYAFSFQWWGASEEDESLVEFQIQTETGSFVTTFPDGPASWREVYLPLSQFGRSGGSTPPNLRYVTGLFWTINSPGLRKVDLLRIYEQPVLRCGFEVRRSITLELKAGFYCIHISDKKVKGKFSVGS